MWEQGYSLGIIIIVDPPNVGCGGMISLSAPVRKVGAASHSSLSQSLYSLPLRLPGYLPE